MFLKRVELQGFKSFADKVVINFEHSITGIVGPNGCGKSNITDAIRWVLGEQSVKSLRGEKMTDVIFDGAKDRKSVGMAEVSLFFDNSRKSLNSDSEEIEITRRIYRASAEAEYLINRNKVRLKDIIDLILDTGLGKDSLSMISQGNILSFAEAKPNERRAIFDEAAGVSKYKKRKSETINRLARVNENLEKAELTLSELEKQVTPLKRQALKAQVYREKKQALQEIEVAVLINDIQQLKYNLDEIQISLATIQTDESIAKANIEVYETANNESKQELRQIENQINDLQVQLVKIVNEIPLLEKRKFEIDEKRKYNIQVGDVNQKKIELESLTKEAKLEYEDRQNRFNQLNADLKLNQTNLNDLVIKLEEKMHLKYETDGYVRKVENRLSVLDNIIKEPYNNQQGVKSIMDYQNSLTGIIGVCGELIKAEEDYVNALAVSLGGAMYNIVTNTTNDARKSIDFLKKNRGGRATFLPIEVLKSNHMVKEHYLMCESFEGFIDVMSNLVSHDEDLYPVVDSLLANVVVCDNLYNANKIAKLLNFKYKVVTLDGDVVHKGGSMTGGKNKNQQTSIVTATIEFDKLKNDLVSYQAKLELNNKDVISIQQNINTIRGHLEDTRVNISRLEPVLDAKRAKYEKLVSELEDIDPSIIDEDTTSFEESIIIKLNEAYSNHDLITTTLKSKQTIKVKLQSDIERKDQQVRQIRKEIESANEIEKQYLTKKAETNTNLENNLYRLGSEYEMTFEFAKSKITTEILENSKDEVKRLRQEIANLGNVNMNAPEEFDQVNARYEELKVSHDDIVNSRDEMLKSIAEMDKVMIKQFKEMFNLINNEINDVFVALFGGGKIKLILEEPDDILNTGVDIEAQPPGKAANMNNRLSGGEKTLIAFCVLFTILKVRNVPLVIFDEADAALDQGNVERFAKYLKTFSDKTQFVVVTHRPGTMSKSDILFGVTMQNQGVSQLVKVELVDAFSLSDEKKG